MHYEHLPISEFSETNATVAGNISSFLHASNVTINYYQGCSRRIHNLRLLGDPDLVQAYSRRHFNTHVVNRARQVAPYQGLHMAACFRTVRIFVPRRSAIGQVACEWAPGDRSGRLSLPWDRCDVERTARGDRACVAGACGSYADLSRKSDRSRAKWCGAEASSTGRSGMRFGTHFSDIILSTSCAEILSVRCLRERGQEEC